jgi:hypothetical protein
LNFSERAEKAKWIQNNVDMGLHGYLLLAEVRAEFSEAEFKQKFNADFRQAKNHIPDKTVAYFIDEEIKRIEAFKWAIETCLDSYSEHPEHVTLDNYLTFLQTENKQATTTTGTTLHTDLTATRLDELYNYLTSEKLIKTTPEMWRFWFTKQSLQAGKKPIKIQWLGAGSVLTNVVMLVCGNFTNHTETAMKAAFNLQSGKKYQQPTNNRNNRGKYPYKRIYEIMEHAETKLQS